MVSLCTAVLGSALLVSATTLTAPQSPPPQPRTCAGVDIVHQPASTPEAPDYSFRLDIADCEIKEEALREAAGVALGPEAVRRGVDVRVGAEVATSAVTIRLHGVAGSGRFRASLEALRARLNVNRR